MNFRQLRNFLLILVIIAAPGLARAATVTETFTFNATLTSGDLLCGDFVGSETSCPGQFGQRGPALLTYGMSIGETYAGMFSLTFNDTGLEDARCEINGKNCYYSDDFLPSTPVGSSPGNIDFTLNSQISSAFDLSGSPGSYGYGTDYMWDDQGLFYYSMVDFELTEVVYTNSALAPVPLPASLPLLGGALFGFGAWRRMRKG